MEFSSPKELSDYLRVSRFQPGALKSFREWPQGYLTVNEGELSRPKYSEFADPNIDYFMENPRYHEVFEGFLDDLLAHLPESVSAALGRKIHITVVENKFPGASIVASPCERFLSIVIHSATIDLLCKFLKFHFALSDPRNVLSYSRTPGEIPSLEQIESDFKDFIDHCQATKVPKGPFIKLADDAAAAYGFQLMIAERFIVCHEIAHAMNVDLPVFENTDGVSIADSLFSYEENPNHRKELAADLVGASLALLWCWQDGYEEYGARIHLVLAIKMFFDATRCVSDGASETHPSPIRRVYNIFENLLHTPFADRVMDCYEGKCSIASVLQFIESNREIIDGIEDRVLPILLLRIHNHHKD